ncbi:MAG TPA: hypothetical protein VGE52_15805 [Pirellulales bacterium]
MKFTVYGVIEDRAVEVTWSNGNLSGDRRAIDELCALALVLEGKAVGPEPEGPFTYGKHLKNALSTMILIEDVFDDVEDVEGQVPHAAPVRHAA